MVLETSRNDDTTNVTCLENIGKQDPFTTRDLWYNGFFFYIAKTHLSLCLDIY